MITITGLFVTIAFAAIWALLLAMLATATPRLDAALRGRMLRCQASGRGGASASRALMRA
jgi:hypothetical protein